MLPAYRKALRKLYTADVNKLLLDLREYRKRINRFLMANESSPALRQHRDRTLTESTLAANRIDGNDVSEARLIELAKQGTEPTSNKEREAMGARFAISTVEDSFRFIRISTGAISQLHRDFFRYSADTEGGRWADNDTPAFFASELDRMAARRFGGELATKRTLLRDACDNYRQAVARRETDPIVGACMFTLDVLNIQPFTSGNRRLARLLFQMLAYQNGYMAPRYESLFARLEQLGDEFEQTLAACPRIIPDNGGEYDAETDYEPFVIMMLGALLDCCKAFESQYDLDAASVKTAEEPEEEPAEKKPEPKTKRSLNDVSREERLAMRAAMQAAAREILQQPVSPAFTGTQGNQGSGSSIQRPAAATPAGERSAAPRAQASPKATAAAPAEAKADTASSSATEAQASTADGSAGGTESPAAPAQTAGKARLADSPEPASNAVEPVSETGFPTQAAPTEPQENEPAGSNEDVVRAFFDQLHGDAAKKDVVAACPSMSAKTVERMIQRLLAEGYIVKLGAARATTYRKA